MRRLCFHWDEAEAFKKSDTARKKLLKQWTHTAKAFGVFDLIVVGAKANIPVIKDLEINIEVFSSYADVRTAYDNSEYVVITETGKGEVAFPKDCIFVVGSNYSNPQENEGDILVKIEADIPLWDVVAAGIILHRAR